MRIQNILDNAVKKKNWSQLPDGGRPSGLDLTGRYVRNILNTVCSDVTSYLEIGLYRGGTFEAALYGNCVFALGIDDNGGVASGSFYGHHILVGGIPGSGKSNALAR